VAIDAARVVKRLGSRKVTVVYRRSEREMPAYPEEIEGAKQEGIEFSYLTAPIGIHSKDGKVTGFECIKTELGPPDTSGRRRPVPIKESEFTIPCDAVIPAIGQKTDVAWSETEPELKLTQRNTFKVNPHTFQTTISDVFAAGDAVTGPATVVEAISAAHKAVAAMHRFILGEDLEQYAEEMAAKEPPGDLWKKIPHDMKKVPRVEPDHMDPIQRINGFEEVDRSFSETKAKLEAARCIDCGGCCECKLCVDACEAKAINHEMEDSVEEIDVGSIILATGFDPLDPTPMQQYGYGRYANVFTNPKFLLYYHLQLCFTRSKCFKLLSHIPHDFSKQKTITGCDPRQA